jgi:hypothetical protein
MHSRHAAVVRHVLCTQRCRLRFTHRHDSHTQLSNLQERQGSDIQDWRRTSFPVSINRLTSTILLRNNNFKSTYRCLLSSARRQTDSSFSSLTKSSIGVNFRACWLTHSSMWQPSVTMAIPSDANVR